MIRIQSAPVQKLSVGPVEENFTRVKTAVLASRANRAFRGRTSCESLAFSAPGASMIIIGCACQDEVHGFAGA